MSLVKLIKPLLIDSIISTPQSAFSEAMTQVDTYHTRSSLFHTLCELLNVLHLALESRSMIYSTYPQLPLTAQTQCRPQQQQQMSLLMPTTGKHNSVSPARNDWINLTFYLLGLPKQEEEGSTSRMVGLGMKSRLMPCKD